MTAIPAAASAPEAPNAPTFGRPFPPVRIASGPAFETIAELSAFTSGPARPSLESGKAWIREVRALAGPDLVRRVQRWAFPLYAELVSVALESDEPGSPEALVQRLRKMPATGLHRRLVGADSPLSRSMVPSGAFDRAIAGSTVARAEIRRALALNPPARQGLDRLFETPAKVVQREVAAVVGEWAKRVSPSFASRSLELIERDIVPKEGLLRVTSARDALRVFTRGVDIDPTDWANEIIVVPTVAMRPFMAPVEHEDRLIILCSVADETMDAEPGAPPRRLVQAAAALGDELRLRILHELKSGDCTATQLAERVGFDRTSLHHHLGILRSAGLLAVRADGVQSWRYSLRPEGVTGATDALASYLGTAPNPGRRGG